MEDDLTNELLKSRFKNQFDLVNYAIKLADNLIKTGRPPRVKLAIENPALQVLAELEEGKDKLEEIHEEDKLDAHVAAPEISVKEYKKDINGKETGKSGSKHSERKKIRLTH